MWRTEITLEKLSLSLEFLSLLSVYQRCHSLAGFSKALYWLIRILLLIPKAKVQQGFFFPHLDPYVFYVVKVLFTKGSEVTIGKIVLF